MRFILYLLHRIEVSILQLAGLRLLSWCWISKCDQTLIFRHHFELLPLLYLVRARTLAKQSALWTLLKHGLRVVSRPQWASGPFILGSSGSRINACWTVQGYGARKAPAKIKRKVFFRRFTRIICCNVRWLSGQKCPTGQHWVGICGHVDDHETRYFRQAPENLCQAGPAC